MKKITILILVSLLATSFVNIKPKTIYIQPLGDVNQEYINYLKKSVESFYGSNCVVKPKLNLTSDILAGSKTRYEAGKILKKYNYSISDETIKSCISNLNFEFIREKKDGKLISVKEIYDLDIIKNEFVINYYNQF